MGDILSDTQKDFNQDYLNDKLHAIGDKLGDAYGEPLLSELIKRMERTVAHFINSLKSKLVREISFFLVATTFSTVLFLMFSKISDTYTMCFSLSEIALVLSWIISFFYLLIFEVKYFAISSLVVGIFVEIKL